MRALITGASGFAGTWLTRHLEAEGDDVVGLGPECDITEPGPILDAITAAAPDVVFHLAAAAHVGGSWIDPGATYAVNATGTLHVLDAARRQPRPPRVVLISSGEVYGAAATAEPVAETARPAPVTPYAASKLAAELLARQATSTGLEVVCVRSFNHVGPGQSPSYLVPALAARIAEAKRSGGGTMQVGNLSAVRDFSDVRDTVRAYRLLATDGVPGEPINVCSGVGRSVAEVAALLVELSSITVDLVQDPALVRPVDLPVLVGDPSRIRAMGWGPAYDFEQTLRDVLADADARV